MGRTALNVTGQALVGVIVAKREKILDQETYDASARTSFSAIQAEQEAEADTVADDSTSGGSAGGAADDTAADDAHEKASARA
jgi:hypothetical protein